MLLLLVLATLCNLIYAGVEQVHISYTGKTNEMLVMWISDSTSDPSVVYYGLHRDVITQKATGEANNYMNQEGYTSGGIHQVLLEDLHEGTRYFYKVGGTETIFNFTSAPALGTHGVVFGVIGDVGADPNSEETFKGLTDLKRTDRLDIIIHAGDLSYGNDFPGKAGPTWDKYGQIAQEIASSVPYNPSVGNHESQDSFIAFRNRYATATLEKITNGANFYWSFDYGCVHTIMLSSETDYRSNSPQYNWLVNDLEKVDRSRTPWVQAIWHTPWYNSNNAHHLEGEAMRLSFEPVFYKYKVDIGLVGHVHAYERTSPVYNYVVTPGATRYVTVGNGGTPEGLYNKWYAKPAWSEFRISEWGYSAIKFINATHAHWVMRDDSTEKIADDAYFKR